MRWTATLAAALAAYLVTWLAAVIMLPDASGLATIAAFIMAIGFGALTWRALGRPSAGLGRTVAIGAVVGLAGGFLIGFIGPILLDPTGAQGPMLGLFVTGPLGMLAGAGVALLVTITARD
ncbi:hypothetical protein HFP89_06935 [Wenzhouxiangella sp. XN79A]|uniref:hypothetical protein n=1 Tax=Wenzhouxiangella sp. XN79A TaxID=2724193 RepID=UPI00144AAA6D|nr:hypothetical protein [Wenzhouxiangella sp. XN79A]NKI34895.1 hypothetical protein [Wenzhouxiangella sp. XN79A]